MDFEKFYGKIWKQGTSVVITIPDNLVKGAGLGENTDVVVMIKRTNKVGE